MTISPEYLCQFGHFFIGQSIGFKLGQLRADMYINADNFQPRQSGSQSIDFTRPQNWDAEFIFFFTG